MAPLAPESSASRRGQHYYVEVRVPRLCETERGFSANSMVNKFNICAVIVFAVSIFEQGKQLFIIN